MTKSLLDLLLPLFIYEWLSVYLDLRAGLERSQEAHPILS